MTIESKQTCLGKIFKDNVVYVIPEYQRGYVWNQEEQWEPLWDDVQNLAEKWLRIILQDEEIDSSEAPSHFLGAMVVQQERNMPGQAEVFIVIDGQQRLITSQILLDAVHKKAVDYGLKRAGTLKTLIRNEENEKDPIKIRPALADLEAFEHAMKGGPVTGVHKEKPIVAAHEYFKSRADDWLTLSDGGTKDQRLEALYIVLTELLKVVMITISHKDDPQIIFETLNARGTPLLQSELVKNYLIYHAKQKAKGAGGKIPEEHLRSFTDKWFSQEVRQGSVTHPRIEQFLFYWITMRMAENITVGDVFLKFKEYVKKQVKKPDISIIDIAADLQETSEHYRHIEDFPDSSPLKVFLDRNRILDMGVIKPLLLWLLMHADGNDGVLKRVATALESYLIRRTVVGRTAAALNRMIVEILSALRATDSIETGSEIIIGHLKKQQAHTRIWPPDEDFRHEFCNRPLYGRMARRKVAMLLRALDEKLKESSLTEQVSIDYGKLSIEHIMPDHWQTENWPLPKVDGASVAEERNKLLHTMGNLTLVTPNLNSKMADKSWENKRKELQKHSGLFLNKDLCEQNSPEVWDEDAIMNRASRLAEIAIQIWPSPDSFSGEPERE